MTTKLGVCAACALLVGALVGLSGCKSEGGRAATGAAAADPPAGVAAADPAKPAEEAKHIDAFGVVKPRATHAIVLEFPATLEQRVVSEGERVRRGQVLFRFSSARHDAEIEAKSYELAAARLELERANRGLQKARDELSAARDEEARAQQDLGDKQRLLAAGAVPRREVEEAERTLRLRQQSVRELARALEEYEGEDNSLDTQKRKTAIVEQELTRLQAQSARPYLAGSAVVCDVREGVVAEIGYAEGDIITSERKLCAIIDLDSVVVEANVPEEFVKDVRIGSRATVVPVADNAREYEGRVTRISSQAVKSNGETVVPTEITLSARDAFLLPGFNVDVGVY
jgi:HlyD family secretion protein